MTYIVYNRAPLKARGAVNSQILIFLSNYGLIGDGRSTYGEHLFGQAQENEGNWTFPVTRVVEQQLETLPFGMESANFTTL